MRIDPAINNEIISQLEAMLGIKTEKVGKEIVLTESLEQVRSFFRLHPGLSYTYIRIARELPSMRLSEIKAIIESLADHRFVQIVGNEDGHPAYAYLTPEHSQVIEHDNPEQARILDVFKKGIKLPMGEALRRCKLNTMKGRTEFRKMVLAQKLMKTRDWQHGGITVFYLPQ